MKANKVIPENLVSVRYIWEIHFYKFIKQIITVESLEGWDWLLYGFIEVNFSVNGQQPNFREWIYLPLLSPL